MMNDLNRPNEMLSLFSGFSLCPYKPFIYERHNKYTGRKTAFSEEKLDLIYKLYADSTLESSLCPIYFLTK
jgi:hypothetical protein